jgi:hypothetical protein
MISPLWQYRTCPIGHEPVKREPTVLAISMINEARIHRDLKAMMDVLYFINYHTNRIAASQWSNNHHHNLGK